MKILFVNGDTSSLVSLSKIKQEYRYNGYVYEYENDKKENAIVSKINYRELFNRRDDRLIINYGIYGRFIQANFDEETIRVHSKIVSVILKIFGKVVDVNIGGEKLHLNKNSLIKYLHHVTGKDINELKNLPIKNLEQLFHRAVKEKGDLYDLLREDVNKQTEEIKVQSRVLAEKVKGVVAIECKDIMDQIKTCEIKMKSARDMTQYEEHGRLLLMRDKLRVKLYDAEEEIRGKLENERPEYKIPDKLKKLPSKILEQFYQDIHKKEHQLTAEQKRQRVEYRTARQKEREKIVMSNPEHAAKIEAVLEKIKASRSAREVANLRAERDRLLKEKVDFESVFP